jgi:hypothetical protein
LGVPLLSQLKKLTGDIDIDSIIRTESGSGSVKSGSELVKPLAKTFIFPLASQPRFEVFGDIGVCPF